MFNQEHTHMNKNAYEIRLAVLAMARDDINQLFASKMQTLIDEQQRSEIGQGRISPLILNEVVIEALFPKTADIIQRAEELYKFVSDTKSCCS